MSHWISNYRKPYLPGDITAGITVAIMLVPQAMAYAMLAGLPPIIGLYASVIPLLIYAFFGTSRQLAVGPVAMVSLLVVSGVGLIAEPGSADYIKYAILLSLLVGAIQLLMGLSRLGFLTNFLSRPIISGFTSAAALIIGFSQLRHLLGIELPRTHQIHNILWMAISNLSNIEVITLAIGLVSLILILISKRIHPMLPGPLLAVLVGTLSVWLLGLDQKGVQIVGEVPAGLPSLSLPAFSIESAMTLASTALVISFVGFMESIAVARKLAAERHYEIDANRELIALGLANIAGSFSKGYPVTGGFSRSAVNAQAGANTGLATLITAVLVAITLLFFTPLFYFLPKTVLAAIIMVAVFGLIDLKELKHLWVVKRSDLVMLLVTFFATLTLGIEKGIIVGILGSLFLFILKTTRPHFAILGQLPNSATYRNILRYPEAKQIQELLIIRIDAQFYYGNVSFLKEKLNRWDKQMKETFKVVLIEASSVNNLDSSADSALHEIVDDYRSRGVDLYLANVKGPVLDVMKRSGFYQKLGKEHFFMDVHSAVEHIKNNILPQPNQPDEHLFSILDLETKYDNLQPGELLLDVRRPDEFAEAHIRNSQNIPHDQIEAHLDHLAQFKTVYIYCRSGRRAQIALEALEKRGLKHLKVATTTGMIHWVANGYPTDSGQK